MCTPASTALFACGCVQVIPAYPPGGDTSAGSFGNGRFLISTSSHWLILGDKILRKCLLLASSRSSSSVVCYTDCEHAIIGERIAES